LFVDRDLDGWFEQCLQCSYRRELPELKKRGVAVGVGGRPEDWSKNEEN
jgi:hypothetical protein